MGQSQANEWVHRLSRLLNQALDYEKQLPEREPANLKQVLAACPSLEFMIDGTERPINRPKDKADRKTYYSGKKKAHTIKNHLVVHPESRRVCYLSPTVPGKMHDKKLADESDLHFPPRATLEQDTGFQGFDPQQVILLQPQKKPKGQELSIPEQFINRCVSSARIVVENVIAGIKRCRIVKDVLRNWKCDFDDLVMLLACGLHNFRVVHRSPVEPLNLIDFYFQ